MIKRVCIFLIIINLILGATQVILSGCLSADGSRLYQVEEKIALLEKENLLLEEKIAQHSSLNYIQAEAIKIGFKSEIGLVDYSSGKPVALGGR